MRHDGDRRNGIFRRGCRDLGRAKSVDEIESLYRLRVVSVMGEVLPYKKTAALERLAQEVFGSARFDAFKTDIGIVGTRWEDDRPIIFKTNPGQAFTGAGTFEPGFGCTIADAVVGSCSAYPFFLKKMVTTGRGDEIEVRDGGSALQITPRWPNAEEQRKNDCMRGMR